MRQPLAGPPPPPAQACARSRAPAWQLIDVGSTTMQIAGIGDYNGDGTSEILWRKPHHRRRRIWTMSNGVDTWHDLGGPSTAFNVVKS